MNEKGFTLLELLISVTILSLIAVILFGALRLSARSVESGEKKIDFLERARSSIRIVDSQIQSVLPVSIDDEGEKTYQFTGEEDMIQFPSSSSVIGRQRGYVLVTYRVITDENGSKSLQIAESPLIGETDEVQTAAETAAAAEEKGEALKLFDGFEGISFKYFYKDPTEEEEGEWLESWGEEDSMPEKIQLNIEKGGTGHSIIIPVRVAASLKKEELAVPSPGKTAPGGQPKPKGQP